MEHIGLFEGIGGFSLAARWIGWNTVAWCEWNDFCQKVLSYHFPKADKYGDITKTDFSIYRNRIDILTGGFPCQPYSVAGKRKGKDDDRHLWPEMLRAIKEIRPRWIVGENVNGIVSWDGGLVFNEVQTDLENEGYEVQPVILPACSVNAPHRRDRVWFVAYSNSCRNNSTCGSKESIWQQQDKEQSGSRGSVQINGLSNERTTTNTEGGGLERQGGFAKVKGFEGEGRAICFNEGTGINISSDPNRFGQTERLKQPKSNGQRQFGKFGDKHDWTNWPTQPPICSGNDGLPTELAGITVSKHRTESIKAYGNAIVPQVAYEIFKVIQQMDKMNAFS